jgi:hypothetical protein
VSEDEGRIMPSWHNRGWNETKDRDRKDNTRSRKHINKKKTVCKKMDDMLINVEPEV